MEDFGSKLKEKEETLVADSVLVSQNTEQSEKSVRADTPEEKMIRTHLDSVEQAMSQSSSNPTSDENLQPNNDIDSSNENNKTPQVDQTKSVTDEGTTPSLQIIDGNKQFSSDVLSYLKDANLDRVGLNYHVVAVFGSQSTGKSTLLNALFGTKFEVMNESKRQQTTKGIWMAQAQLEQPHSQTSMHKQECSDAAVVVMDVEGTDGHERWEDQDFERKSALFALATSEVLIVNIWENQIGLYQGANLGLLKTVFEANLKLFATSRNRSLILFVIRDHLGAAPLSALSDTLKSDMYKLWDSINKPDGMQEAKIEDFFDLQFTALPHKVLLPNKFFADVEQLTCRFTVPKDPNYVFKPDYHRNVPIDGWSFYAEQVWDQIEQNKDLDLPSQQILVARFRCEEIAAEAQDVFLTLLEEIRDKILTGTVASTVLGGLMAEARKQTLTAYNSQASQYSSYTRTVYTDTLTKLEGKMDNDLEKIYQSYLTHLRNESLKLFTTTLSSSKLAFGDRISLAYKASHDHFTENANLVITAIDHPDSSKFKCNEALDDLERQLDALREDKTNYEILQSSQRFKSLFSEEFEKNLRTVDETLWDRVLDSFETLLNDSIKDIDPTFESASESSQISGDSLELIQLKAWEVFADELKNLSKEDHILAQLMKAFNKSFRYGPSGLPIVWRPGDDIDGAFEKSQTQALEIMPLLSTAKLSSGKSIEPTVDLEGERAFATILTSDRQILMIEKFKKEAEGLYLESKRSSVQSTTQIPLYMYGLLLVLGWNEIMAVLRSPMYFVCLLMLGAAAYVIHTLHLWGPLTHMTNTMIAEATDMAKAKLKEILDDTPSQGSTRVRESPIPADDSSKEDIELKDL